MCLKKEIKLLYDIKSIITVQEISKENTFWKKKVHFKIEKRSETILAFALFKCTLLL